MDEKHSIAFLHANGIKQGTLELWDECPEDEDSVRIELEVDGVKFSASSERGYFHAFCDIRNQIEQHGLLPLCYAASENVYPSPMIESMGSGEKAYQLTMGVQAKMADLVEIFTTADHVRPVSVAQQQSFYKKWIQSL